MWGRASALAAGGDAGQTPALSRHSHSESRLSKLNETWSTETRRGVPTRARSPDSRPESRLAPRVPTRARSPDTRPESQLAPKVPSCAALGYPAVPYPGDWTLALSRHSHLKSRLLKLNESRSPKMRREVPTRARSLDSHSESRLAPRVPTCNRSPKWTVHGVRLAPQPES